MKRLTLLTLVLVVVVLAACGTSDAQPADGEEPTDITLMLDWVPNVNHTGIFVAQAMGYFEEAGLNVEVIQPGEVFAEQAVTSGSVDFGISFQESVTIARADGAPLVSIAAIIQENTSGFAALSETGIESSIDFEGLTYGSFGSPFEVPTIQSLMECDNGDFSAVDIVEVGFSDPLVLLQENEIDLAWIFYGTQGIAAEYQGIELDLVMMNDYFNCIPNYYTPIFITNESIIDQQPETVRAFVEAVSRGYEFSIQSPEEAANILASETPETERDLLVQSQIWLSERYQGDASRWGIQTEEVWADYTMWMVENDVIEDAIAIEEAFTNRFLP